MKKIVCLFLSAALLTACLSGCGTAPEKINSTPSSSSKTVSSAASSSKSETSEESSSEESKEESKAESSSQSKKVSAGSFSYCIPSDWKLSSSKVYASPDNKIFVQTQTQAGSTSLKKETFLKSWAEKTSEMFKGKAKNFSSEEATVGSDIKSYQLSMVMSGAACIDYLFITKDNKLCQFIVTKESSTVSDDFKDFSKNLASTIVD